MLVPSNTILLLIQLFSSNYIDWCIILFFLLPLLYEAKSTGTWNHCHFHVIMGILNIEPCFREEFVNKQHTGTLKHEILITLLLYHTTCSRNMQIIEHFVSSIKVFQNGSTGVILWSLWIKPFSEIKLVISHKTSNYYFITFDNCLFGKKFYTG